jgi:hypothetical protein
VTAQSRPIGVTATGTVVSGPCSYRGFSIASTAGATVVIYDNTSAAGTVLAQFTLAAGGFQHVDVADGARCELGIHLTATAAIQGHVRAG